MKIVVIVGPYFGDGNYDTIEKNIRTAEEYQIVLVNIGIPCFCPHNHTNHFEIKSKAPEAFFRAMDKEIIQRLAMGGLIALLAIPGWENSEGSCDEINWAKPNNIQIFYPKSPDDLDEVIEWAKS